MKKEREKSERRRKIESNERVSKKESLDDLVEHRAASRSA